MTAEGRLAGKQYYVDVLQILVKISNTFILRDVSILRTRKLVDILDNIFKLYFYTNIFVFSVIYGFNFKLK